MKSPANSRHKSASAEGSVAEAHRLWRQGETRRAKRLCRHVLEDRRDHPGALHLLALMARAAGDDGLALDCLRRGAQPLDAPFYLLDALAEMCLAQGLLDEAADAAERAVGVNGGDARAWHRLALVRFRRNELDAARIAFERSVATDARSVDALNNLGIVLQQLGRPDLAAERYRQAIALDPGNAEVHSNLAASLSSLGEFDDALTEARHAVFLKRDYASPYVHAALAEAERGQLSAALEWIDRLLSVVPEDAAILVARADILGRFDRFEDGVVDCRKAIALQPDFGRAYESLGILLGALGRDQDALAAFDKAIALSPNPDVAIARKGLILLQLGLTREGMAHLDEARARRPHSAFILYSHATASDFRIGEPERAAMENLLAEGRTVSRSDRIYLHFALGGAYLQSNEPEKIFRHLNAGNAMWRALFSYDIDAEEARMRAIAEVFSRQFMAEARTGEMSAPREDLSVFVVGMPRSGTTLVEQILASHPKIFGAGELSDFPTAVRQAETEFGLDFPELMRVLTPQSVHEIGRNYLARLTPPPDALRVVDKNVSNGLFAGLIHRALPHARIIYCRRDALDTCLSCYSRLFVSGLPFTYDLAELGRYYRAHEKLMAHWKSILPAEIFIEIEYEKVVDDIENAARRLIAFCGLEWSPSCIRFHETDRAVRTSSTMQVRKPVYRSSIGRGRRLQPYLAPLLDALGLPPATEA